MPRNSSADASITAADAQLLEQIRRGDAQAGHRFVRDYYPGIYRYLLYLTGRPEMAEDLTQETFLQGWRRLETFEGRSALKPWLHRIAHREFLQALRSQRLPVSLEEIGELPAPSGGEWAETVELREIIRKLPREEGEVVLLHYLEGYTSGEIAKIVGMPAGTVRYRLSMARAHLQRELGEGDLTYLNQAPGAFLRRWAWLPLEALIALEARLSWRSGGGRTTGAAAATRKGEQRMIDKDKTNAGMSRRKLLETAGTAAAAVAAARLSGPAGAAAAPQNEAEIIDGRLTRKLTVAAKATALSDLCAQLQADTGIQITAGPSVADEKVTLFCEKLPMREVMRQLSRPFGYTWLRTGPVFGVRSSVFGADADPNTQHPTPNTAYRYELVQDLRSQLLEEELRDRDRNAALIALDQEMQRYRPYLDLSPDEALARSKSAGEGDKKRLEALSGAGWGPIQMYFQLSPAEQTALLAGQELKFSQQPKAGERPLPPEIARGVLQSQRGLRMVRENNDKGEPQLRQARADEVDGLPPSALPEARAAVTLSLDQTELGRFGFSGSSDILINGSDWGNGTGPYAVGQSHAALQPENATLNAKLAHDPALQAKVTVKPVASGQWSVASKDTDRSVATDHQPLATEAKRVTSADVLEALHRACGMPIVSDFYTRVYAPETVTVNDQPLFEALNSLADTLRLRWHQEDGWLQFRSVSFYNDRPKEVPNRLLSRWAAARREHGHLTLDDLIEIAGLTDTQLDAHDMVEGAKELWGLEEWGLVGNRALRPHLRWMASFTPAERQKVQHPPGLRFTGLPLSQQQQFMSLALGDSTNAIDSLQELATAAVQIDYSLPGQFEWKEPEKPGGGAPRTLAPVRAPTRDSALAAARRLDPQADLSQIQPTVLEITLLYYWGTPESNGAYRIHTTGPGDTGIGRWRSKMGP